MIAFEGEPANIYTFTVPLAPPLDTNLTLAPTPGTTDASFMTGASAPSFLGDGSLVFFTGWITTGGVPDHDLHIMRIPPSSQTAIILHSFNASVLGFSPDLNIAPDTLMLSYDGTRAVGNWPGAPAASDGSGGAFSLDFTTNTITRLADYSPLNALALSQDGQRIAYVTGTTSTTVQVFWVPFTGGAPTLMGNGAWPTWAGDNLLGFQAGLDGNSSYVGDGLYTYTYPVPNSVTCQQPVLAPIGQSIAFLTVSGDQEAIAIAAIYIGSGRFD